MMAEYPLPEELVQSQPEVLSPISVETVRVIGNRGPCGGVNMAVETTDMVLRMVNGRQPVYTTNEIVHYPEVMDEFTNMGLVLVPSVEDIPDGAITTWSAHGHTPEDDAKAKEKGLITIDTTCTLVEKVQNLAKREVGRGNIVPYLGSEKRGKTHPETRSILGHAEARIAELADAGEEYIGSIVLVQSAEDARKIELRPGQHATLLSQTTMSVKETKGIRDELKEDLGDRLDTRTEAGICLATNNRQHALAEYGTYNDVDGFIVVGDISISHNTKELAKLAGSLRPTIALASETELDESSFPLGGPIKTLALTSGASVPDRNAPIRILNWFQERGAKIVYDEPLIDEHTASFQKPAGDLLFLAQHLQENYGDEIPEDVMNLARRRKLIA